MEDFQNMHKNLDWYIKQNVVRTPQSIYFMYLTGPNNLNRIWRLEYV